MKMWHAGKLLLSVSSFVHTMPEITVTEDQYERLDGVRSDLQATFVDTYGRTHIEDAVEYLLDTYTPPDEDDSPGGYDAIADAEYPQLQSIASDTPGVAGSGISADEMRGKLLAELGAVELAERLGETTADGEKAVDSSGGEGVVDERESASSGEAESGHSTLEETTGSELSPEETAGSDSGEATEAAESESVETDSTDSVESASGESVGNLLPTAATQLLDEHDDKWREGEGDARYEVDLPDGTTVSVRTKDDVRQHLFRHY